MHCHRVSVKYEIEVNVAAVLRDLFTGKWVVCVQCLEALCLWLGEKE